MRKVTPFLLTFVLIFSAVSIKPQLKILKPGKVTSTTFAIIVDDSTYMNCTGALMGYKKSVEEDGLGTYILVNHWETPDQIKTEIIKLYKNKSKLEGIVLVGDIPIPMIRNAQHMTSAFKLDEEKYPWFRSSVPSDRFYDDFDLKFSYLKKDEEHQLCHYYSLLPESPQKIERDIYSARIKPSGSVTNKYDVINTYLERIVTLKKEQNQLDKMMVFLGHGYLSNALTAWADEKLSLREQFPELFIPGGKLTDYFHEMNRELKEILISELQKNDLDVALFHAHGDVDLQLLLSYPVAQNVNENIEAVKLYLRSKLRTAKERKQSIEKTKVYFKESFDVPDDYFNDAFEDSSITADSLLNYKLDMHVEDIREMKPQPRFVMFDECFNGSFHQDEYVAGEYVFGNGNVVVGEGNSVNCLQDKWADEFLGWLNEGVRIGQRHKGINLLESHLIGDPTYHFTPRNKNNLSMLLTLRRNDESVWRPLLQSQNSVLRAAAVKVLSTLLKNKFEKNLVEIYKRDISYNVRMQALKQLAILNGDEFRNILLTSIHDPYEFIRRKSAEWMGEVGDVKYLPVLVNSVFTDESDRVVFNGKSALGFIGIQESIDAVKKYFENMPSSDYKEQLQKSYNPSLERNKSWIYDEIIPAIKNDTLKLAKRIQEVKTFRNYKFREVIPSLTEVLRDKNQPDALRINVAETLGWFSFSIERSNIIAAMNAIINESSDSKLLKDEALKTKRRLEQGANDVILP